MFTSKGVNLIKNEDDYFFDGRRGGIIEIIDYMKNRGIDIKEIIFALEDMNKNKNNVAHFGTFGTFIYSMKE